MATNTREPPYSDGVHVTWLDPLNALDCINISCHAQLNDNVVG